MSVTGLNDQGLMLPTMLYLFLYVAEYVNAFE